MKNKAKCKLCETVIESFHAEDYVTCKCGEIFVDGGDSFHCGANLWCNFLRVDDEGNEIIPKIQEKENKKPIEKLHKPTKKELLDMLDEMIKSIESLPSQAMTLPINHYDFCSLLLLLSSILHTED